MGNILREMLRRNIVPGSKLGECQKIKYPTDAEAQIAMARAIKFPHPQKSKIGKPNTYLCVTCGYWHWGHGRFAWIEKELVEP